MQRNPLHYELPTWLLVSAATVLLLLLLLPLIFLPLRQIIFVSQSLEIRRIGTNSNKLEKMVFTANAFGQLNFTRARREFIYQGNMYDVHSITKYGNQVVVLALWDAAESTILQALHDQDNPDSSKVPGVMRPGFMPYFCVEIFRPDLHAPAYYHTDYLNIGINYTDPSGRICSPPPEQLTFS